LDFLQLAVAGKARATLHGACGQLRKNPTGFDFAEPKNLRQVSLDLRSPAWPAAARHLNLTHCGDTKPSMRRDVSDENVKI
jgi:hypothetical protein